MLGGRSALNGTIPSFMASTERVTQIYILGRNSGIKNKRLLFRIRDHRRRRRRERTIVSRSQLTYGAAPRESCSNPERTARAAPKGESSKNHLTQNKMVAGSARLEFPGRHRHQVTICRRCRDRAEKGGRTAGETELRGWSSPPHHCRRQFDTSVSITADRTG